MCGIGLATKGFICKTRVVGIPGGGGVVYRDRKPASKFKFPKVDAELIEVIGEPENCVNVTVRFVEDLPNISPHE